MPEYKALADNILLADNSASPGNPVPHETAVLVASATPEAQAPGEHAAEDTVLALTLAIAIFVALVIGITTVILVAFKDDMQDIKRDMRSG